MQVGGSIEDTGSHDKIIHRGQPVQIYRPGEMRVQNEDGPHTRFERTVESRGRRH
ncbi:hypothetical protein EFR01_59080 [Sinorhizobium fredii]|nr:hypothetical protein EFR01_59080 [Sinorhizobium fredii]GLS11962.1 hypothetical protein GCM10007864_55940 [Sinorhizobium fredii]